MPFHDSPVDVLNSVSMLYPKVEKLILELMNSSPSTLSTVTSEKRFIPITAYT